MSLSVSERCCSGLATLRQIVLFLSQSDQNDGHMKYVHVNEELDRFGLFVGNIGALHQPHSPMSIESRLHEASDVLIHVLGLLTDLNEVSEELLEIISGGREGMVADTSDRKEEDEEGTNEEDELREEIGETITRLFRASILIRQAAPTDLFAKALSRNQYTFNDQFDIAHVSEKYCKLATDDSAWLCRRLGRAITQRRRYLGYIRDHHEKLEGMFVHHNHTNNSTARPQAPAIKQPLASRLMLDTASNHSFLTKATTIDPARITPQLLAVGDSEPEDDALSYTTISRSIDGDRDSPAAVRIPKLDHLRIGSKKEIQCPFCFRIKKFNNTRTWRKHVFSDLRSYVCTFPDCDAPYFGDINAWFNHEMTVHRVTYKCFLCANASFHRESNYLSHMRREHTGILRDGKEQLEINLARKPLAQIPVSDCPCCSDWADRLRARMIQKNESGTDNILVVVPTVFKRHLASHLEQLALFAIPIDAAFDDDKSSNAAIGEENSKRSDISQMSTLTFESSPGYPDDATYVVTDFSMIVEGGDQPVHDFTQSIRDGRQQDWHVTDNTMWNRQYPEFAFLQKQADEWTKKCQKVLVCDASIKVLTEARPGAHLSISFDLHSQRDLRLFDSLECTTRFYDDGEMDADPLLDGPHSQDLKEHRTLCEYTPDPHGSTGRLRLAFGSRFWVNRMSKYQSLRHKDDSLVSRSLMKLTATQDVYGISLSSAPECILTILWRFRQTRESDEVGVMKWRAVFFSSL
jgi:hypothetical protein